MRLPEGVYQAGGKHAGRLRIAIHFYNRGRDLEALLGGLRELL